MNELLLLSCIMITESLVQDVDGDDVRCRWAVGSECSGVCQTFPAVLNMVNRGIIIYDYSTMITIIIMIL